MIAGGSRCHEIMRPFCFGDRAFAPNLDRPSNNDARRDYQIFLLKRGSPCPRLSEILSAMNPAQEKGPDRVTNTSFPSVACARDYYPPLQRKRSIDRSIDGKRLRFVVHSKNLAFSNINHFRNLSLSLKKYLKNSKNLR